MLPFPMDAGVPPHSKYGICDAKEFLLNFSFASFGYHAGGWGKPPVDELGKPLYGDVFGTAG